MTLKRTPLYDTHVALGARLVDFGGWEMPVQYPTGIIREHEATRTGAGLFDISHMGEYIVRGSDALALLNYAATNDLSKIVPFQAQYNFFVSPEGDTIDDTIIFRFPDYYYVVVNGGTTESDFAWLQELAKRFDDVQLENVSDDTAKIDLQGPQANAMLQAMTDVDLTPVTFYRFTTGTVAGVPNVIISRTGYTGEDGFELFMPADQAVYLWQKFTEAGAVPVGLGARDTLRMEAGLPLRGSDIGENGRNPLEAGFGWAVKLQKGDFVGREALLPLKENPTKKWVTFEITGRGVARPHYPIATPDGEVIGEVTSGTFAPTLNKNIGMGWVKPEYAQVDTELAIIIRDKPVAAIVRQRPMYKRAQ